MVSNRNTAIVVVKVPPSQTILFQGILNGENGMAVMRSLDADNRNLHELWTVPDQLSELYIWLATLPPEMDVQIVTEKPYVRRSRK